MKRGCLLTPKNKKFHLTRAVMSWTFFWPFFSFTKLTAASQHVYFSRKRNQCIPWSLICTVLYCNKNTMKYSCKRIWLEKVWSKKCKTNDGFSKKCGLKNIILRVFSDPYCINKEEKEICLLCDIHYTHPHTPILLLLLWKISSCSHAHKLTYINF